MGDQQEKGDLRSQGAAVQGSDALTEPQRLWVEALRSGDYPPTMSALCRLDEDGEPVGWCCLGVACEVAVKAGIDLPVERGADVSIRAYGDDTMFLPPIVRDWLGLRKDNGGFNSSDSLSQRNDSGVPFKRIADLIESRPEGLFA
jgi:hypothetical protein